MRNRTAYPSISPTPSDLPTFSLTEKGLRIIGVSKMEKVASRLRQLGTDLQQVAPEAAGGLDDLASDLQKAANYLSQEVPPSDGSPVSPASNGKVPIVRYGTVCGRYRQDSTTRRADLRVGGLWLKGAGFGIGQKYEI